MKISFAVPSVAAACSVSHGHTLGASSAAALSLQASPSVAVASSATATFPHSAEGALVKSRNIVSPSTGKQGKSKKKKNLISQYYNQKAIQGLLRETLI